MKRKIRKISIGIFVLTFLSFNSLAQQDSLKEKISHLDGIVKVKEELPAGSFKEAFDMRFVQPIDHNNPDGPNFEQRIYLSHKGFDKPMVVILEGYTLFSTRPSELTNLLDANQLIIEHRFFKDSKPDSIPWGYLNIRQAAADQHNVIQQFKKLYKGKWISTGISKGGQATTYHRRFYPKDVDVSVPYVAPLNYSDEEPKVYEFLDHVGSKKCRDKIHAFQTALFERKDEIFPIFDSTADAEGWEFVMGREKAYDIIVLEYEFAFWQWDARCTRIPEGTESPKYLYSYWTSISPFSFIEESGIEPVRPFFYQAMTEIGMYGYEAAPFKEYLKDTVNIRFDFSMPKGVDYTFKPEVMADIHQWVQDSGNYMLFVYGEYDAWSASAAEESDNTNARVFKNPQGTHASRIYSFPPKMKKEIFATLEEWLGFEVPVKN